MPRQRSWTDDQLREAVAASTTLAEVGDHTDNRLENLRILCGNCHSQTET